MRLHFAGTVLFEDMKGTAGQERRWQRRRQEVYEGSEMHFLRAAASDRIEEEGFRLFQFTIHQNPERPSDSVIAAKIKLAKKLRSTHKRYADSVSFWEAKMNETKVIRDLLPYVLTRNEVISATEFTNRFAFGCDMDALCVVYSKDHHFPEKVHLYRMYDKTNHERTLINFYAPYLFFENNGWVINPDACSFIGAWEKYRVAGLLPLDYEPPKTTVSN